MPLPALVTVCWARMLPRNDVLVPRMPERQAQNTLPAEAPLARMMWRVVTKETSVGEPAVPAWNIQTPLALPMVSSVRSPVEMLKPVADQ
jgi:hypothetical protein